MIFTNSLIPGRIIKRYKRFLADIELDNTNESHPNKEITAYVCNTGSMRSCWSPGQKVLLSYHDSPKRKLKYQLELIHNDITWIGLNTSMTNKIVIEGITKKMIPELTGYKNLRPEIKLEKSRLDILLYNSSLEEYQNDKLNSCFVEIKSVTLKEGSHIASFPDSISKRGQKHLEELIELKENGYRAVIFYLIQREDVSIFTPAQHIDPQYAALLKQAIDKGVEILIYNCKLNKDSIIVNKPIPYDLNLKI